MTYLKMFCTECIKFVEISSLLRVLYIKYCRNIYYILVESYVTERQINCHLSFLFLHMYFSLTVPVLLYFCDVLVRNIAFVCYFMLYL
jgi:hypothetical protein